MSKKGPQNVVELIFLQEILPKHPSLDWPTVEKELLENCKDMKTLGEVRRYMRSKYL